MKINRERKIYASLLGIAGVALAADQLFFADAQASSEASAPQAMAALEVAPSFDPQQAQFAVTELNSTNSLAHRLKAIAHRHDLSVADLNNAFEPTTGWIAPPAEIVKPLVLPGKEFESRHQLSAIMSNSRGGVAIVDSKPVEVGQEFDGFKLVSLSATRAVFKAGDAEAVLERKRPSAVTEGVADQGR